MKTENKNIKLFAAKWWNPLFWLFVVFAPVFGIIAGSICGAVCGLLMGYGIGLDLASRKMEKIIAKLP